MDDADDPNGGLPYTHIEALFEDLTGLAEGARSPETREEIHETRELLAEAHERGLIDSGVRQLRASDATEAFVGSVFFSIPFPVEDGVFDVADYFLSFRVGYFPVFFLANTAFVLLMIAALVYWAGPQDVRISRPILGVVPRRLVGIALVSFLTVRMLMAMWGRVGAPADPVLAVARMSVVWTVASFGAALGDILPGEKSGDDTNDDLAELGGVIGRSGEDGRGRYRRIGATPVREADVHVGTELYTASARRIAR